ncbi:MAG: thiamine-phosphate kinase [Bacteroidales bacterium]
MKLSELGEFGFINRISEMFRDLQMPGTLGIGDDCAIIPYSDTEDYVITTDLLIEEIHFLRDRITPYELGYKSLAVNLSDIAAMGAIPVASFLSIGIPAGYDVEYLDLFLNGYKVLSQKYNVPLLGGDTTKSGKHFMINVGVTGKCGKGNARLRSMAQSGDIICITGFLGDSAGGLEILLSNLPENEDNLKLIKSHHLPEPQINEGIWLAKHPQVHAMMDISDGISSDLSHILKASRKSAIINLDKLPVSATLNKVASKYGWDIDKLATSGGEDYVLLCTVEADYFDKISSEFYAVFNKNLFRIGEITDGESIIKWKKNGKDIILSRHGYDHFIS